MMATRKKNAVQTLVLPRKSTSGVRLVVNPVQFKICRHIHAISSGVSANHSDFASQSSKPTIGGGGDGRKVSPISWGG